MKRAVTGWGVPMFGLRKSAPQSPIRREVEKFF
jgi:hypothetical protein